MINSEKINYKIKRLLLDFKDDEEEIEKQKQKTKYALQRLQNKSKGHK